MPSRRPESRPSTLRVTLARMGDRASRAGVWLLPPFYVGFVAMLLLIWRAPGAALWLAAAAVLASAMGVWALLFAMTSRLAPDACQTARPADTARRAGKRITPLRSTQMPTRACAQACAGPDGARTQFMVACFHANCAANIAKANADAAPGQLRSRSKNADI